MGEKEVGGEKEGDLQKGEEGLGERKKRGSTLKSGEEGERRKS